MHQNQWVAAIEELRANGLEQFLVPGTMPLDRVMMDQANTFWNCSAGLESHQGRWAKGPTIDGTGKFQYLAEPRPLTPDAGIGPRPNPLLHGTAKQPTPPTSDGPNPRANGHNGRGRKGRNVVETAVDALTGND